MPAQLQSLSFPLSSVQEGVLEHTVQYAIWWPDDMQRLDDIYATYDFDDLTGFEGVTLHFVNVEND